VSARPLARGARHAPKALVHGQGKDNEIDGGRGLVAFERQRVGDGDHATALVHIGPNAAYGLYTSS